MLGPRSHGVWEADYLSAMIHPFVLSIFIGSSLCLKTAAQMSNGLLGQNSLNAQSFQEPDGLSLSYGLYMLEEQALQSDAGTTRFQCWNLTPKLINRKGRDDHKYSAVDRTLLS